MKNTSKRSNHMHKLMIYVSLYILLSSLCSAYDFYNGLVSVYDFEQNYSTENLTDYVSGYNSTYVFNIERQVDGKHGKAWEFESTSGGSYATMPTSLFDGVNGYTVIAWYNAESLVGNAMILSGKDSSNRRLFMGHSDYDYGFWRVATTGGEYSVGNVYILNTNSWQMISMTYNNTMANLSVYGNGTYYGSAVSDSNIVSMGASLNFGSHPELSNYFDGKLDEMYIWHRQLSYDEIQALWNDGDGLFYSDNFGVEEVEPVYVNITYPENDSFLRQDEVNITFSFGGFDAVNCSLWSNQTGYFEVEDYIATESYNITQQTNQTINTTKFQSAIGLYRFENINSSVIEDESGLGNDGINVNSYTMPSYGKNETGDWSREFDGVVDWINISNLNHNFSFNDDAGDDYPFSMGGWVQADDWTGFRFLGTQDTLTQLEYSLFSTGDDTLKIQLYDDVSTDMIGRSTDTGYMTQFEDDWIHIAVTYDGSSTATGLKIYINGEIADTTTLGSGSYTSMKYDSPLFHICVNNPSSGSATYCDGRIDEVFVYGFEMTQGEVIDIMNTGFYNQTINTTEENITISTSLNKSENYTLSMDVGLGVIETVDLFVNCRDGEDINSSIITIEDDSDFTPPVITMVFPPGSGSNNSWNQDLNITFTTDEYAECEILEGNFTLNSTDGYTHVFTESSFLTNGYYEALINCSDMHDYFTPNSVLQDVYFTKDREYPIITVITPDEGYSYEESLTIKFILNDDIDLYDYNFNITNDFTGEIFYSESSNISGKYYNVLKNIGISNASAEYYTLSIQTCDSHTKNDIKDALAVQKNNKTLRFVMDDADIRIESLEDIKDMGYKKEKDRYTFDLEFKDKKNSKKLRLSSNKNIAYLKDSPFKGHFVIDNRYWVDFEQKGEVLVEKDGDRYVIEIFNPDDKIHFRSIGELNCYSTSVNFYIGQQESEYNINILGDGWFNNSIFDATTVAGVLIYMFLFFIICALVIFGEYSRVPAISLFASVAGFFYGFLLAFTVSIIFGILFMAASIIYGVFSGFRS